MRAWNQSSSAARHFPTTAEIAPKQQAIADAYEEWLKEVEEDVEYAPPDHDGPSEVPTFSELMSATPAQLQAFDKRVRKAAR